MHLPELKFEEEGHVYSLHHGGGFIEYLPSVSEIIKPLEDYSMVDTITMFRAAEYGTNVHKTIELWLKGVLDEETLDEGLRKPLEGFKAWFQLKYGTDWEKDRPSFISEKRLFHEKLKYAGTIDLQVCEESIIDFKTRKYNPVVDPVRLAAYKAMLPEFPPLKTYVLEIDVEGNCKLIDAHHRQAWSLFRLLLDRFNNNKKWDLKINQWKNR